VGQTERGSVSSFITERVKDTAWIVKEGQMQAPRPLRRGTAGGGCLKGRIARGHEGKEVGSAVPHRFYRLTDAGKSSAGGDGGTN